MKTTLLIMAAGIGSRFGTGIKQLEPVGDAIEAVSIMWYLSSARIPRRSLKKSSETALPLFARLMM